MPTSRHRAKHKQKAKARTKQIQARRAQVKSLVSQLETQMGNLQEFTKPEFAPFTATAPGVYLTPTPDEYQINEKYDNLEI